MAISGSACWGHSTGVTEDNTRTFSGNWTGTGSISGAGDAEVICLDEGEYMISEVDQTGTYSVTLLENEYAAGDTVTMWYRHGASDAACQAAAWNLYVAPFNSLGFVQVKLENGAPLRVSATNSRYLEDVAGNPVYLAGFHTWYNTQDGSNDDPPDTFDWDEFLTAVVDKGCNFIRLWTLENFRWWPSDDSQIFYPPRYDRTGPGNANDGKLKVDLTQVNDDWLDRLEARVIDAWENGVYVSVMLFNGFNVDDKGDTYQPAYHHPYLLENNINSLDGDQDDDGSLLETQTDTDNVAWSYQQDLVEAVIDRLNSYDNIVAWELCNEPTGSTAQNDWCNDLISHIQTYESAKPKQHLVWYTVAYPNGSNTNLDSSAAECVAYNAAVADTVVDGTKVSIYDTDHTTGGDNTFAWIWTSLCEGHGGAADMDPWVTDNGDYRADADYEIERANLGYALARVNACTNFLLMTPQPALSSSGFCLARDHATAAEYICYYNGSSTFTLDLSTATGTLDILWLRCSTGATDTDSVSGGDTRTLTPPWTGAVVAYVYH